MSRKIVWVTAGGEIVAETWSSQPLEDVSPPSADLIGMEIEGDLRVGEQYFGPGGVLDLPPRPGPWAAWDGTAWVDARTQGQLAEALAAARRAASLDKSDLLIRLATAGILTAAEAEEAAAGVIPASMAAMLAALPEDARMAARIKWSADNIISRTHPVIVAAAFALGISDETLDQIFEVTDP